MQGVNQHGWPVVPTLKLLERKQCLVPTYDARHRGTGSKVLHMVAQKRNDHTHSKEILHIKRGQRGVRDTLRQVLPQ